MRVAIIPARGGSRRIPHKNKRLFHGRPIIEYSIEAAKECGCFDQIVVSTDDNDIRDIAWKNGARYREREHEFSGDDVQTRAMMANEVKRLDLPLNAEVCCLYPCAPMVKVADLHWGHTLLVLRPAYFVVAIGTEPLADAGQFYWSLAAHWIEEYLPIYGIRTAFMPIESRRVCDINTENDWRKAEEMYAATQAVPA